LIAVFGGVLAVAMGAMYFAKKNEKEQRDTESTFSLLKN